MAATPRAASGLRAGQASPLPGTRLPERLVPGGRYLHGWRPPGWCRYRLGYGRLTGPLALITWWKATGGLFCTHLPPELAPMPRMLSWYVPLPLIPA